MKAAVLAPALLAFAVSLAAGYFVELPMSLDEMEAKADVIFQGTVVSNTTVADSEFGACPGPEGAREKVPRQGGKGRSV